MKPVIQTLIRETIGASFAFWIMNSSIRALGGSPEIKDLASAVAYGLLFIGCLLIGRRLAVHMVPKDIIRNEPDYYSIAIAEIERESAKK